MKTFNIVIHFEQYLPHSQRYVFVKKIWFQQIILLSQNIIKWALIYSISIDTLWGYTLKNQLYYLWRYKDTLWRTSFIITTVWEMKKTNHPLKRLYILKTILEVKMIYDSPPENLP